MNLPELSVRRPILAWMLAAFFVIMGLVSWGKLSVDLFPNIESPMVTILTVYPGASPDTVETLISRKLEDAMSSITAIERIDSVSSDGVSSVLVEFELGEDVDVKVQDITQALNLVKNNLPEDSEDPIISKVNIHSFPVLIYGAFSESMDQVALRDFADETLRKDLEQIRGVARVDVVGGAKREIRVDLYKDRMMAYGISPDKISKNLALTNMDIPGGDIDQGGQNLTIKTASQFTSLEDLRESVIDTEKGRIIRLKDVADVKDLYERPKTRARINAAPSVTLMVVKQAGANTVQVAHDVKKRIEEMKKGYAGRVDLRLAYDGSEFIVSTVEDIRSNIVLGAILATVVCLLFLGSIRATLAIALSIPISLLSTFVLYYHYGFTLNTMSLMALAAAVGLVVDDSIVVLENIYRHKEEGKTFFNAAIVGAREVTLAVMAATLSVVAVFLPIGFMSGVMGQFFRQFGVGVAIAILVSMVTALTIIPVVMSRIPDKTPGNPNSKGGVSGGLDYLSNLIFMPIFTAFNAGYRHIEAGYVRLIGWALGHRAAVIIIALIAFVLTFPLLAITRKEFLPSADEGQFSISIELPPDASLDRTDAVSKQVETILADTPAIDSYSVSLGSSRSGFGIMGGGTSGANQGQISIRMIEKKDRPRLAAKIFGFVSIKRMVRDQDLVDTLREKIKGIPGAKITVTKGSMAGGGTHPVWLLITDQDERKLKRVSDEAFAILQSIEGTVNVDTSEREGKLELHLFPDVARLGDVGLTPIQLAGAVRGYIEGTTLSVYRERGKDYDIVMRLAEADRENLSNINSFQIYSSEAEKYIPLAALASAEIVGGPVSVQRHNRARAVTLTADLTGKRGSGDIVQEFFAKAKKAGLISAGTSIDTQGESRRFIEMMQQFGFAFFLGIIFTYMVLASQFNSLLHPFNIMLALPLGTVGLTLGLVVSNKGLNIMSFIGLIMLTGLVTKNSILLIDRTNQLRESGVKRDDALKTAGRNRLRPIIMTTLTTIFGVLPAALSLGEGSEFRSPMAVAVIGGLTLSTLLTLVVIPVSYSITDDLFGIERRRGALRTRLAGGNR